MDDLKTINAKEIAERLGVSLPTVYMMLEKQVIPALRPGAKRWIISRARYEQWEATFGAAA